MSRKAFVDEGGWIKTYSGKYIEPLNPDPANIDIYDIAHSLANQCRFTGHTNLFYSVAQHSVLVSTLVPKEDRLWALLHDATEAYLADIARPIKRQAGFGEAYKLAEDTLMVAVADAFGLSLPIPPAVKAADSALLGAEQRDLMDMPELVPDAADIKIIPWKPLASEQWFLSKYAAFTGETVAIPKGRHISLWSLKRSQRRKD
jgi:hypothetical protein